MRIQTFWRLAELFHIMFFFYYFQKWLCSFDTETTKWPSQKKDFPSVRGSASCTALMEFVTDSKLITAHPPKKKLSYPSLTNTHLILAQTISFYSQLLFLNSPVLSLYGLLAWMLSINYLLFLPTEEQTQEPNSLNLPTNPVSNEQWTQD